MEFQEFVAAIRRLEPDRYRYMRPEQPAGNRPIILFDTERPCGNRTPLTAVVQVTKGILLDVNDNEVAVSLLGLSPEAAERILDAVWDLPWARPKDQAAILVALGCWPKCQGRC